MLVCRRVARGTILAFGCDSCPRTRLSALGLKKCIDGSAGEAGRIDEITLALLGESVCPYCGVGCRLRVEGEAGEIVRIRGVESAPANLGRICAKGAQLGPTIHTVDRSTHPLMRRSRKCAFTQTTWDGALDFIATRRLAVASERSGTPCWLVRLGGTPNLSGARMR